MSDSVIRLGAVAACLRMIEVSCSRCPRFGRLSTARLLAEYGPDTPVWVILKAVSADCPRANETRPYELCGVRCLSLLEVDP